MLGLQVGHVDGLAHILRELPVLLSSPAVVLSVASPTQRARPLVESRNFLIVEQLSNPGVELIVVNPALHVI